MVVGGNHFLVVGGNQFLVVVGNHFLVVVGNHFLVVVGNHFLVVVGNHSSIDDEHILDFVDESFVNLNILVLAVVHILDFVEENFHGVADNFLPESLWECPDVLHSMEEHNNQQLLVELGWPLWVLHEPQPQLHR